MPPSPIQIPQSSCYELVATGSCSVRASCPYNHSTTARLCTHCNSLFPSVPEYTFHTLNDKHKDAVQKQETPKILESRRWCITCHDTFQESDLGTHYAGRQHLKKHQAALLQLHSLIALVNIGDFDVNIVGSSDMGVAQPGQKLAHLLIVTTPNGIFELIKAEFVPSQLGDSIVPFTIRVRAQDSPVVLSPEQPLDIRVFFEHTSLGRYACNLELTFQSRMNEQSFIVNKNLVAAVGDNMVHEANAHRKLTTAHRAAAEKLATIDLGVVQKGKQKEHSLTVTTTQGSFQLIKTAFASSQPDDNTVGFKLGNQVWNFLPVLSPDQALQLRVLFQHNVVGRHECDLELIFRSQIDGKLITIEKHLAATVLDSKAQNKPKKAPAAAVAKQVATRVAVEAVPPSLNTIPDKAKSHVPHPTAAHRPEKRISHGAVSPLTVIPYKSRLPPARVPSELASAVSQGSIRKVLENVRKAYLPEKFSHESYGLYFKVLLWIEEVKADQDILIYDMRGVSLERQTQHHWLTVPGLAEKRPSVLLGDRILIRKQSEQEGGWHAGRVCDVQQLRVGLQLPDSVGNITAKSPCDVRFKLNRASLQRQHYALGLVGTPDRFTFPDTGHICTPVPRSVLTSFVNPKIFRNPRQIEAVNAILARPAGSIPFVIFGPPGTGKTVTVVEAINQVLRHDSKTHILVCAPSNSAADIIARRLVPLGNNTLLRLYAPSWPRNKADEELLPFTFTNKDGQFSVPSLSWSMAFRVVVTTCVSAWIPFGVGVPRGHFTHIFIDESGQATEPEVMIPIRTMANSATSVILSGDPKQLGPVIRSGVARELGLGKSYLERLMENPLYDEKSTDVAKNVIKLTKNYRSHNAILHIPNYEFYEGDLEPCADPQIINSFIGSELLPPSGGDFPLVFYGVLGNDARESTSTSFFNMHEITAIQDYVQQLKGLGIADEDIGIVASYRAQCQKLRLALKDLAGDIKVGSVEEFQGDERLVMIISTVRSNKNFLEHDARFTLGFVSNPKRFNVAVTRAKALLLVVGDPHVLSLDPVWRSFLNYIFNNGGWKGVEPDWDTTAPVDQTGEVYVQQRRELELTGNRAAELTARLHSLDVADDTAGIDRPGFREVE